jgi:hypothetical protein
VGVNLQIDALARSLRKYDFAVFKKRSNAMMVIKHETDQKAVTRGLGTLSLNYVHEVDKLTKLGGRFALHWASGVTEFEFAVAKKCKGGERKVKVNS